MISAMIGEIFFDKKALSWGCNAGGGFCLNAAARHLLIPTAVSDAAVVGLSTESEEAVFVDFTCTFFRTAKGPLNYVISNLYYLALSYKTAAMTMGMPAVASVAWCAESTGVASPTAAAASAAVTVAAKHPMQAANGPAVSGAGPGPVAASGVYSECARHERIEVEREEGENEGRRLRESGGRRGKGVVDSCLEIGRGGS